MSDRIIYTALSSDAKISQIFWHAKTGKRRVCLKCKNRYLYKLKPTDEYKCKRCGYKFNLYSKTLLERIQFGPRTILEILHHFALDFSANKTARELELTSKRVWRVFHQIRQALKYYSLESKFELSGVTEVDESYFGAKFKNRRQSNRKKLRELGLVKRGRGAKILQQPVFGIYKRNGSVYVELVDDTKRKSIVPIIRDRIVKGAKVYSDTWSAYDGLVMSGYIHKRIDHGAGEYVAYDKVNNEKVHINGMEGFWGYAKERLMKYHGVSRKHLNLYIKEIEFRYNNRSLKTEEFRNKILNILLKHWS